MNRTIQAKIDDQLMDFRDKWIGPSKDQSYSKAHSTLGIFGAIDYAMGIPDAWRAPACRHLPLLPFRRYSPVAWERIFPYGHPWKPE